MRTLVIFAGLVLMCSSVQAWQALISVGSVRTPQYTEGGMEVCLRCHSGEKMHAIVRGAHGDGPGCESCHGPGSFHVSRAHGGRGFPQMITFGRGGEVSSREVQLTTCLACHSSAQGERSPLIWWGSVHDRKNINCATCHRVHLEVDPIKEKSQQDKTCFRCHRKQKTEHPRFEDKSVDFDTLTCWTCHDVHNTMKTVETPKQNPNQTPGQ